MSLKWFLLIAIEYIGCVRGFDSTLDVNFLDTAPLDGCTSPDVIGRCTGNSKIDLVFLIDTADPNDNIENVKSLIRDVSSCVTIRNEQTAISILKYRQRLNLGIPLGDGYYTQNKFKLLHHLKLFKIKKIGPKVDSHLGSALKTVSNLLLSSGIRRTNPIYLSIIYYTLFIISSQVK
jgi:hypothetical protein